MDVSTRDAATEPRDATPVEVTVKGALDAAGVRGLRVVLDRVLARRPCELVIDLADCPFLDAAAIEVLVDAHRRAWREGGLLTLRDPSPRVRRILEIARVDHVLRLTITPPIQPDPEPAGGHGVAARTTGTSR